MGGRYARPVTEQQAVREHGDPLVVAVVVTYNRRQLLGECLEMLASQTRLPDAVVVVDNASTDGSPDMVRERFPQVDLVHLTRNTGGAGGFSAGLAHAIDRHGADLVWAMDDDTIPTAEALAELLAARVAYPSDLALVASRVVWSDGQEQPRNIPRDPVLVSRPERMAAMAAGGRPIRTASFVSLLIDADAVREQGLPTADFFIWNDDFEFTARILRRHKGIYAPRAVVVHKTTELGTKVVDPGPRFYNEVRNKVWTFRAGQAFSPPEAVLRMVVAVRNWLRFYLHSSDRAAMRKGLKEGLRDGFRSTPRPTAQVLSEAGYTLAEHW